MDRAGELGRGGEGGDKEVLGHSCILVSVALIVFNRHHCLGPHLGIIKVSISLHSAPYMLAFIE